MRECLRLRVVAALAVSGLLAASPTVWAQATWSGAGANLNYSNPANWVGDAVPVNDGSQTLNYPAPGYVQLEINTSPNVAGIYFNGSSGSSDYVFYQTSSEDTLTLGSGGISTSSSVNSYPQIYVPVLLSSSQTWDGSQGYIFDNASIGETGPPATLTLMGSVYLLGTNTFTGGLVIAPGAYVALGQNSASTGPVTIGDSAYLSTYYSSVDVPGPVTLGNNVTMSAVGYSSGDSISFGGTVTLAEASTTLTLDNSTVVNMAGTLAGPTNAQLEIDGNGSKLPNDGGSLLVFSGALSSQVTGLTASNTALILAPTGDPTTSFASLAPSGLQVLNGSYLGLDGMFTNPNAVVSFLNNLGLGMGGTFSGTLGFDSTLNVVNPGETNTFNDPIDLSSSGSNFHSTEFLGLGSSTTAILSPTAVITPYNNSYVFGGGGGTLTVQSPLVDNGSTPRNLEMTAASTPLTLIVQGTATYTGGTVSNGGVLIFDAPVPTTGSIETFGGYVGETELATNVDAQQFVALFDVDQASGVIGFDETAADLGEGRTITDDIIDLSGFTGHSAPFLGTSTDVTLDGATIIPANNTYQFAAVKGGRLTVATTLTDTLLPTPVPNSVVIGLVNPIENLGTNSVVTLTGSNTYTGGTTFNSGTLFINNDGALGITGTLSVPNTGTALYSPYLAPYGVDNVTLSIPIAVYPFQGNQPGITLGNYDGGTMLTLSGVISDYNPDHPAAIAINGPVTLTAANTYSGGTTFVGGGNAALYLMPGATVGASTGQISLQSGGTLVAAGGNVSIPNPIYLSNSLTLGASGNTNTLTLGGTISGYSSLSIESNVELDGANTYSGGTYIYDAQLTLGTTTAFGTGPVSLSDSTLDYASANPLLENLSGDSTSAVNLGPETVLTLDVYSGNSPQYYGTINGDGSNQVVKTGAGSQYLGGVATYSGATTVAQGILFAGVSQALGTGEVIVNSGAQLATDTNAVLTNPIILNSGGTLAGSGNFSPPDQLLTFAAGSTVQPGNPSLGTATAQLTFGTLGNSQVTFGSGGFYLFTVEDANGAPGTGYSTVDVSGAVTITATAEAPFTVQVAATSSQYGYAGPAANFNPTLSYSWTLLTAGSITGFDTNAFYIDPSLFAAQNSLMGGSFAVDEVNGNTLTLDFTPVPEPSTWILLLAGTALIGLGFRRRVRS